MGAPRQTRNLQLLTGRGPGRDSGGRPIPEPVFSTDGSDMPIPEPVLDDPVALAEWDRVVPTLLRDRVIKPEDGWPLGAYCLAVSQYRQAVERYAGEGPTTWVQVGMPDGSTARKTQVNPTWRVVKDAAELMLRLAKEFGLTPVASAGLGRLRAKAAAEGGDEPENPFAGENQA